ncbi:MAG: hypothetical protein KDI61_11895 [Alphaproteobacteria bacterium]|nr:hypothetical protein [Alphaproteobacteria bacterium]
MTDELMIDIYASPEMHGLAILIDKPFQKKLLRLDLDLRDAHLIFVFEGGEHKDLGEALKSDLVPFFQERQQVKFNIVNVDTLAVIESFMIPLSVIPKDG